MNKTVMNALLVGAIALAATAGYAAAPPARTSSQQTPKGWSYEIKDGKRVPEGQSRDQSGRQLARGSQARAIA